jgi:hypothetical protein
MIVNYYSENVAHVDKSFPSLPQTDKDLLAAFMTISAIRDLLFEPSVKLATDLTDEFLNEVLIVDLNQVIKSLRDYLGSDRRGVYEALGYVEGALKESYAALAAERNINKRVTALIAGRGKLDNAYRQLEHLNQRLKGLDQQVQSTTQVAEGKPKEAPTRDNVVSGAELSTGTKTPNKRTTRTQSKSKRKTESSIPSASDIGEQAPPNLPETVGESEDNAGIEQSKPTVSGVALSDIYSQEDLLGYKDYMEALASFIESPKTKKPLTIGIEAAWGGGKTTLMRMLEERLGGKKQGFWDRIRLYFVNVWQTRSLRPITPQYKTVWFDAWLYDKEEALWAAMALEIWSQVGKKVNFIKRSLLALALNFKRIDWSNFFNDILKALAISFILVTLGYLAFVGLEFWLGKTIAQTIDWLRHYIKVFAVLGLVSVLYTVIKDIAGIIVFPFRSGINRYLRSPDYAAKVGFIREFQQDFKSIIESITQKGKWPLIVFIDDLDRCTPNKAAEVIEAINLLLDSEYSVFIIGMDADMLSRSIQAKYKDIQPFFEDSGYRHNIGRNFLEKIIQIDFRIPCPDATRIKDFIHAQLGKSVSTIATSPEKQAAVSLLQAEQRSGKSQSEAQKVIEEARPDLKDIIKDAAKEVRESSFEEFPEVEQAINDMAPYLNYNPRRIKRFINIFRLQALIAYHRGLLETSISYDNLARWVVISMRWPEFLDAVIRDSRVISQIRLDIASLLEKTGKPRVDFLEDIKGKNVYSELLLSLLTDKEFESLLASITGKAIEAQSYLYFSQITLTS